MSRDLSAADWAAIDEGVRSVAHRLRPEDRFDLRQDLAIKLLTKFPANVVAWAIACAQNWTADFLRDEARHRELLHELHDTRGAGRGYRVGSNWQPEWFPPHEDASTYRGRPWHGQAWLACNGARVMNVKASSPTRDIADAYATFFDFRCRKSGRR